MAIQKPLVIIGGQVQQIPAGDSLSVAASEVGVVARTNANAGALVIGTPVYASAAGAMDKAGATTVSLSKVIGLVQQASISAATSGFIQADGVLTATTAQWDAVAGTTGGLVFGTIYYLSATAGLLTATAPVASGSYVLRVGVALSTTELMLNLSLDNVLLA